jgi:hypothetical protein
MMNNAHIGLHMQLVYFFKLKNKTWEWQPTEHLQMMELLSVCLKMWSQFLQTNLMKEAVPVTGNFLSLLA